MIKKKSLFRIILVLSVLGIILFFPLRYNGSDCCLGDGLSRLFLFNGAELKPHHPGDAHQLMMHYVFPFGFLWWSSIALAYWSFKILTQKNQ